MAALKGNAKIRARKSGWNFDLSLDFLEQLWNKQRGLCALTGQPMSLSSEDNRWDSDLCSLDRIDAELGYTQDNVQLTTSRANYAKGVLSTQEFVEMCKQVVNYHG